VSPCDTCKETADHPHFRFPLHLEHPATRKPRSVARRGIAGRTTGAAARSDQSTGIGEGPSWRNVCPGGSQLSDQAFDNWVEAIADAISEGFEAGESALVERESRRAQPRHNP
jgi:hypothetical protein